MCQYHEFEAAEMSMGAHLTLIGRGESPFVGVLVFPSREFRHANMFVRAGGGIERPEELRGRRIGVPEYGMTACVWMRAILHHEYGVAPQEVIWCTGGQEVPGRKERVVVRRDVYARHPWVAQSLFKAFSRAKAEVERALADNDMLTCMLPWSSYDLEVTRRLMGQDFWPYGVEPNRKILEAMCQYTYEQGLTPRRVGVEELFAPNTAEAWRQ